MPEATVQLVESYLKPINNFTHSCCRPMHFVFIDAPVSPKVGYGFASNSESGFG